MNTDEKGYLKFHCYWKQSGAVIPPGIFKEINRWRDLLFSMGLVGAYENGIGYGNLSVRSEEKGLFFITGTATGKVPKLGKDHYSLVEEYHFAQNSLTCSGPERASAESLSHAAIYETLPWVNAVIHVHHAEYWKQLRHKVPTTHEKAEYGTPEMGFEIIRLLADSETAEKRIIVMGGHPEGILSFGKDMEEAGSYLLAYINTIA
jgi:L-ribulose-5-phosphate 4-epimerase